MGKNDIETYENLCFVGRPVGAGGENGKARRDMPAVKRPAARAEKDKVFFKFGKIRVQVTSAKRVKVSQSGEAMILELVEKTSDNDPVV